MNHIPSLSKASELPPSSLKAKLEQELKTDWQSPYLSDSLSSYSDNEPQAKGIIQKGVIQDTIGQAADLIEEIASTWLWSLINPLGISSLAPADEKAQTQAVQDSSSPILAKPKPFQREEAKAALEDLRQFFQAWKEKVQDSGDEIHVEQVLTAYLYRKLEIEQESIKNSQTYALDRRSRLKELIAQHQTLQDQLSQDQNQLKKWSALEDLTVAVGLSATALTLNPILGAACLAIGLGIVADRYFDNAVETFIAKKISSDPEKQSQWTSSLKMATLAIASMSYLGGQAFKQMQGNGGVEPFIQNGLFPLLEISKGISRWLKDQTEEKKNLKEGQFKQVSFDESKVKRLLKQNLEEASTSLKELFTAFHQIQELEKRHAEDKVRQLDRRI